MGRREDDTRQLQKRETRAIVLLGSAIKILRPQLSRPDTTRRPPRRSLKSHYDALGSSCASLTRLGARIKLHGQRNDLLRLRSATRPIYTGRIGAHIPPRHPPHQPRPALEIAKTATNDSGLRRDILPLVSVGQNPFNPFALSLQ